VATRGQSEQAWHQGAHEQRDKHLGPTGVWSTARLEGTAVKVGKVPRVAEALPHSEGAAYNRRGRESAACLWDWRMGSEYAMRVRDNRTRAGAKDPWGREVKPLAQRHAEALDRPGLRAWSSSEGAGVRRVMTNGSRGGGQAGSWRSLFRMARVGRSHLISWP